MTSQLPPQSVPMGIRRAGVHPDGSKGDRSNTSRASESHSTTAAWAACVKVTGGTETMLVPTPREMPFTIIVGTGRLDLAVMGPNATKPQERSGTHRVGQELRWFQVEKVSVAFLGRSLLVFLVPRAGFVVRCWGVMGDGFGGRSGSCSRCERSLRRRGGACDRHTFALKSPPLSMRARTQPR